MVVPSSRAVFVLAVLLGALGAPVRAAEPIQLKLADAESSARLHQPQLLQARAGTEAAEARVGESRAGLLPQITANAAYKRTTGNYIPTGSVLSTSAGTTTTSATSNNSFTTYNAFSDSIVASQLIWDFKQTWDKYGAAGALAESAQLTEKATLLSTLLNVRAAFFAARADKALALVARQTVVNDEKHLGQTEGFYAAGIKSEVDVAQTRTDLANAQLAQVNADNGYVTARQQLLLAMGVVGSTDFDVADESIAPVPGEDSDDLNALVDEALKQRPEMTAFAQQAQAQQATIDSTRGGYGPSLYANVGFSQGGEALDNLGWNGYVGVSLTWNLFQGGLTNATVREAEANLRNIAAQTEGERQQIASDVNTARLAVRAGLSSQQAAGVALKNAKELLRLAEAQYQTGIGSIIQLSDAQVAESSAEAQVIQADFNLAAARAQLLKALGRP